jgi:hypothetical protein
MAYKVTKIRKSYTNSQMKKQVKSGNQLLQKLAKISPIGWNNYTIVIGC